MSEQQNEHATEPPVITKVVEPELQRGFFTDAAGAMVGGVGLAALRVGGQAIQNRVNAADAASDASAQPPAPQPDDGGFLDD